MPGWWVIGIALWVLLTISGILSLYTYRQAMSLPANRPERFLQNGGRQSDEQKIIVCAGDSITHGAVSANYVDKLEAHFTGEPYIFVNAGVNSELAYNLELRLDDIIACKPDVITILIGTNDVNATITKSLMAKYMREQKLPTRPTLEWYRENLLKIIQRLKAETRAKIGLLSIPMLGEDLDSAPNKAVENYVQAIKAIAEAEGLTYLPLHEQLVEQLNTNGKILRKLYDGGRREMYGAIARRHLLKKDWNVIAEGYGFELLTDHVHLNERGAEMVSDLIEDLIRQSERKA